MVQLICSLNLPGCNAALLSAGWAGGGSGRALALPGKWDRVKEGLNVTVKSQCLRQG